MVSTTCKAPRCRSMRYSVGTPITLLTLKCDMTASFGKFNHNVVKLLALSTTMLFRFNYRRSPNKEGRPPYIVREIAVKKPPYIRPRGELNEPDSADGKQGITALFSPTESNRFNKRVVRFTITSSGIGRLKKLIELHYPDLAIVAVPLSQG